MNNTFLIITSIAGSNHHVLRLYAEECAKKNVTFLVIGDTKSPVNFELAQCNFYSVQRQQNLNFELAKSLPFKHYARKNLGYLIAMQQGAEIIIETDDDNLPMPEFWSDRKKELKAYLLTDQGWVNIYSYFSVSPIWPRGFPLEHLHKKLPHIGELKSIECPIQQGLADVNPDVDAVYRLTMPLPVLFSKLENIAIGNNSFCPFNSQNTTWYKEAFLLLYLPSYCSFRMTDIWRSFIAQRIASTCGWPILFHQSTVWQDRNTHNLLNDFRDEIPGYLNNSSIIQCLKELELKEGTSNIPSNLVTCYQKLIDMKLIEIAEMDLLNCWIHDVSKTKQ